MKIAFVAAIAACTLFLAFPLAAAEVAGVSMPAKLEVGGKQLTLNGMGLRSKAIFKVYVAGLYAENGSSDAGRIIAGDQTKQVRLVMMRSLDRAAISDAVEEGFQKNSARQMPILRERLDTFLAPIPDLKSGDELVITYVPGRGTSLSTRTAILVTVPGKDFADAIFSVWLGANPVDAKLKAALLGG